MRKKREHKDIEYEGGFKPGMPVIITSKTTFKGAAIGAVLEPQKWCDGGIPVATTHKMYTTVCIRKELGDTIEKVGK